MLLLSFLCCRWRCGRSKRATYHLYVRDVCTYIYTQRNIPTVQKNRYFSRSKNSPTTNHVTESNAYISSYHVYEMAKKMFSCQPSYFVTRSMQKQNSCLTIPTGLEWLQALCSSCHQKNWNLNNYAPWTNTSYVQHMSISQKRYPSCRGTFDTASIMKKIETPSEIGLKPVQLNTHNQKQKTQFTLYINPGWIKKHILLPVVFTNNHCSVNNWNYRNQIIKYAVK